MAALRMIAPNEVQSALRSRQSRLLTGITVATTHAEIASGQTEAFLRKMVETADAAALSKLAYRIYINRPCEIPASLGTLIGEIGFEIVNLNLDPADDIHNQLIEWSTGPVQPMGLTAGPNITFFRIMRDAAAAGHDTILLLETDCKFGTSWLERLAAYVEAAGNFWIAGALYDGHQLMNNDLVMTHINGVALYQVGCAAFQEFLNGVEQFIKWKVKYVTHHAAYDTSIREYINNKLNQAAGKNDIAEWIRWRYVNRCVVPTQLIVNASCKADAVIPEKDLKALYNYAVLHQK